MRQNLMQVLRIMTETVKKYEANMEKMQFSVVLV